MRKEIIITIEEHVSETFIVDAESIDEAIQIAEQKYNDGEFVLAPGTLTAKFMKAESNGCTTTWIEF